MIGSPRVGDVGTVIELTIRELNAAGNYVVVDVSSATTKQILLQSEGGTLKTRTASFSTNGTDGKVRYTTVAGDLDVAGRWKAWAYIVTPTTSHTSDEDNFKVGAVPS